MGNTLFSPFSGTGRSFDSRRGNFFSEKCPLSGQRISGMILKNGYHSLFAVVKRNEKRNEKFDPKKNP
jgi:hypothetical protein